MSLTLPKPFRILPKVPSVAVIGLLALQYAWMSATTEPKVHCDLIVERPHVSTHLAEKLGVNAVKLNITSKCNASQRFTEVEAWIEIQELNAQSIAYNFGSVRANAMKNSEKEAQFENLYVECRKNLLSKYKGFAKGFVTLTTGKRIPVQDDSNIFIDTNCRIGAQ